MSKIKPEMAAEWILNWMFCLSTLHIQVLNSYLFSRISFLLHFMLIYEEVVRNKKNYKKAINLMIWVQNSVKKVENYFFIFTGLIWRLVSFYAIWIWISFSFHFRNSFINQFFAFSVTILICSFIALSKISFFNPYSQIESINFNI